MVGTVGSGGSRGSRSVWSIGHPAWAPRARPAGWRYLVAALITVVLMLGLGTVPAAAATAPTWPTISSGQQGPNVTSIQYLLRQRGETIGADGDFGALTKAAVQRFQTSNALNPDGVVGPLTWAKLVVPLDAGASGEAVRALQTQLNRYGAALSVDGSFSGATSTAVTNFKTKQQLGSGTAVDVTVWQWLVGGPPPPRPDHIVLVMFENKKYSSMTTSAAPYLNSLAAQGARFTKSFGITHPSQPNYIALLSGSVQGVTGDECPKNFTGKENLAHQLIAAGLTFKGYSETMPSDGYTGCASGTYVRKHNSWVDFDNVPASSNLTYASFPTDYSTLPTVSFVTPNLCNDMHDCAIGTGDTWTKSHLDGYAQWAKSHNSLLIVTFDEDNFTSVNQIFTAFVGQHVKVGSYPEQINHYSVLRTIESAYGLAAIGGAASATPISDVWQ
jgi:peptidoglycan hydrolase-like protein with peptidoglycan-binding domain